MKSSPLSRAIVLPFLLIASAVQADISGTVFQDDTFNGVYQPSFEPGVQNVTVTARDAAGTAVATDTTAVDGTYTLTGLTASTEYRIEFTTIPSPLLPGPSGPDSDSAITFRTNPATGVNFGVVDPDADYLIAESLFMAGVDDAAHDFEAVVGMPHAWTSDPDGNVDGASANASITAASGETKTRLTYTPRRPDPIELASTGLGDGVGAVYGLAWNESGRTIYASAYLKRRAHFGQLGNDSTGAIYDIVLGQDPALYVDLNTIDWDNDSSANAPGECLQGGTSTDLDDCVAGLNTHPLSGGITVNWDHDDVTRDQIGKRSLGDIDIANDDSEIYVVNMNDRQLYIIPTSGALDRTTITRYAIPTTVGACSAAAGENVRPFAVGVDNSTDNSGKGNVYVGAVCDQELEAYVWSVNRSTGAFTLQLTIDMSYTRTESWNLWNDNPWGETAGENLGTCSTLKRNPQPNLSDIAFDGTNMILGMRDRHGDVGPPNGCEMAESPTDSSQVRSDYEYYTAVGDIRRACGDLAGGWTIESGSSCGGVGPTGGSNEFYFQELPGDGQSHGEASNGALAQIDGANDVISTAYDAVYCDTANVTAGCPTSPKNSANYPAGGLQRYDNSDGTLVGAYDLFIPEDYWKAQNGVQHRFAKSSGLGDIEALTGAVPTEVGDRLWEDSNNNGIQDPGEAVLAGVTVQLIDPDGTTVLATAVTDANGNFIFSNDPFNTDTTSNQYNVAGLKPSTIDYELRIDLTQGAMSGLTPTDANQGSDAGIDSDATLDGTNAVIAFDTGTAGVLDHGLDAGFKEGSQIGDTIWLDLDGNGVQNDEPGIAGVEVSLTPPAGVDIGEGAGNPITTTTDSDGNYLFSGLLATGDFTVTVNTATLPAGLNQTGDPDQPGIPCTSCDNQTVVNIPALGTSVLTADFGYQGTGSIGDYVWSDTNGDGVQDAGESGIDGVTIDLYIDNNNDGLIDAGDTFIGTQTTSGGGLYDFTGLPGENYLVDVTDTGDVLNGVLTAGSDPRDVTLGVGVDYNDADFGYYVFTTIGKQVDKSSAYPGEVLSYTIYVSDTTSDLLSNVQVTDSVPAGTTYVGDSDAPEAGSEPAGGGSGNVVWNLGSNDPGPAVDTVNPGVIYALQGSDSTDFTSYSLQTGSWSGEAVITLKAKNGAGVATDGTYIYAIRGDDKVEFQRFDPAVASGSEWTTLTASPLPTGTKHGDLVYDGSRYVYALAGNDTTSFYRFDTTVANPVTTNGWSTMPVVPDKIKDGGSLASDGTYIYAFSGKNATTFYRFDAAAGSGVGAWTTLTNSPVPVDTNHGDMVYDGSRYIYALTGNDSTGFYRFDTTVADTSNGWSTMPVVTSNVKNGGSLTTDGTYIYAYVGDDSTAFYRFDPTAGGGTGAWGTPLTANTVVNKFGDLTAIAGSEVRTVLTTDRTLVGDLEQVIVSITLTTLTDSTIENVTAGGITINGFNSADATCGTAILASVDDTINGTSDSVVYTWNCIVSAGAPVNFTPDNEVTFSAGASGDGGASFDAATSNSVLVIPPLTFEVTVNDPATVDPVVNQATLTDDNVFTSGVDSNPVNTTLTPTYVTIGKVQLDAALVSDFLDELGIDRMDSLELLELLDAWDPQAAAALAEADRAALIAALRGYLDPDGDGHVAVLRWDTLEERGTIGFYSERRQGESSVRINNDMLPGLITAPMGGEYLLADPGAQPGNVYQYLLIEQEARGATRAYGPYTLEMP